MPAYTSVPSPLGRVIPAGHLAPLNTPTSLHVPEDKQSEYYRRQWLRHLHFGKKIMALYNEAEEAERRDYLSCFGEISPARSILITSPPRDFTAQGYYESAIALVVHLCNLASRCFSRPGLPRWQWIRLNFGSPSWKPS